MSCWVVPSLAAEVWQIPLSELMRRIAAGEIEVRAEGGFTFVDVAPHGPRIERPNLPAAERPPTFAMLEEADFGAAAETDEERAALAESAATAEAEDERGPEDDTQSNVLGDWRSARKRASRQRIPPPPRRLSA